MRFKWRRERVAGYPTSSNRASSLHLRWDPAPEPTRVIEATLEVVEPPAVNDLYFWALQVSFFDRGRHLGAAHLGLQWYARHPGSTAVNWGGYRDGAGELEGDLSLLPSATGNRNTRDYAWRPGTPYRLTIAGDGDGWWTGSVTDIARDETTIVRRLRGGGDLIGNAVVWSEVFARCDAPSVVVRWSDLSPPPQSMRPSYQRHEDGGCANTRSERDGDAWMQITNVARQTHTA